jgi:hypothetical protein
VDDDSLAVSSSLPAHHKAAEEPRANESDFSNAQESDGDGESEPDPDDIDPTELQMHEDSKIAPHSTQNATGTHVLKLNKPLSCAKSTSKKPVATQGTASPWKAASILIGASMRIKRLRTARMGPSSVKKNTLL